MENIQASSHIETKENPELGKNLRKETNEKSKSGPKSPIKGTGLHLEEKKSDFLWRETTK